MSSQVRLERAEYYRILEKTQKGTMDVTLWMDRSLGCLGRVIGEAQKMLEAVPFKGRFWESVADRVNGDVSGVKPLSITAAYMSRTRAL